MSVGGSSVRSVTRKEQLGMVARSVEVWTLTLRKTIIRAYRDRLTKVLPGWEIGEAIKDEQGVHQYVLYDKTKTPQTELQTLSGIGLLIYGMDLRATEGD